MPFITREDREKLSKGKECEKVGEICYLAYVHMVDGWKARPSWTTWSTFRYRVKHDPMSFLSGKELEQSMLNFSQDEIINQIEAASEVFYTWYVVDYEKLKEQENGTI